MGRVHELETYWHNTIQQAPGAHLRVDLTWLCRVDAAGRDLLSDMYRARARLVAKGCVMPVLVREIVEAAQETCASAPVAAPRSRKSCSGRREEKTCLRSCGFHSW